MDHIKHNYNNQPHESHKFIEKLDNISQIKILNQNE